MIYKCSQINKETEGEILRTRRLNQSQISEPLNYHNELKNREQKS